MDRILTAIGPNAGPGPRRPLRDARLVVAGPGHLARAELAHVAGDDTDHRRAAGIGRHVEPVVRPFAVVDLHRLDGPAVARIPPAQGLRRGRDLTRSVQGAVL